MSDTARDYQTIPAATTDGMDDFFDGRAQSVEAFANPLDLDATPSEPGRELDAYISVEEASARLKLSSRAIQKRLKRGTMSGVKVKVGASERWLVNPSACLDTVDAPCFVEFANSTGVDATLLEPGRELDAKSDTAEREPVANTSIVDAYQADSFKDALIKDLQSKLEAASFRVGYLQHYVESQDAQIKLLTDSQHNRGWWAKFSSWFFKAQ